MPAFSTIIAAAGLGIAAAGTVMNYQSAQEQKAVTKELVDNQAKSEDLRQKQMNLDAARRKREVIRAAISARSQALATTVAQGAAGTGSSALGGAFGAIAGREGTNFNGINQNQQAGNEMFAINRARGDIYRRSAEITADQAFGSGLGSLGGALVNNAGTFGKIGTWAASKFASA